MNPKKILFSSFALSICFHLMALVCFQRYSLWFSSAPSAPFDNWLSLVDKKERDQILEETFDPANVSDEEKKTPLSPKQEQIAYLKEKVPPTPNEFEIKNSVLFQLSFPQSEELISTPVIPTFFLPTQSLNLLDHLPKDLIIPEPQKKAKPTFSPFRAVTNVDIAFKAPNLNEMVSAPMIYPHELNLDLREAPEPKKLPANIPFPDLPKLPTLKELETSSYSDAFDADLVFLPKSDGTGYVFALTLIPKSDLNLPELTQHITFLIDKSNSIQQGRLAGVKSAIHKSLDHLLPTNTFNIIAFDSKMEKMSPNDLPCKTKSFAIAEDFLDRVQLGSFFSTSDLYRPLFLTVPGQVQQDELYTAILLTDGESLSKQSAQLSLLQNWTQYNDGKVSLFAIGMNDAAGPTLEAATFFNRGKLINTTTTRGMKRMLSKLLKMIQRPLAKNISYHAISKSPKEKISLFIKDTQIPHLYVDQPFVILGETETLDDFILFVQGRLKNRWLNVKKTVSFLGAKKGTKSLQKEIALQKAYGLYEKYFVERDPKHIADAADLLESYSLDTPLR